MPHDDDLIMLRRGRLDLERWKKYIVGKNVKGKLWFINWLQAEMGTPGMVNRSGLQELFTDDEIRALSDSQEFDNN